jgi:hypothetical protein
MVFIDQKPKIRYYEISNPTFAPAGAMAGKVVISD